MRTIEFVETRDGMIYALFKTNGQIVNLRFVGFDHNCGRTIKNWLLDAQVPVTMN